jgi:hypothetical protein
MQALSIATAVEHAKRVQSAAKTTQNALKSPWVSIKEQELWVGEHEFAISNTGRMT